MENDIRPTSPRNSLTSYAPANVRRALTDRVIGSEAIELVAKLLTCWPNANDDSKGYIGALAAVLQDYPRCVAVKCVDPRQGVPRETKFQPTVADLVAWCEREVEGMRRIVDREDQEQAWDRERKAAAFAERDRLATAREDDKAYVARGLAEVIERLNAAVGRHSEAQYRAEAEAILSQYRLAASQAHHGFAITPQLAQILRGKPAG
jgi:hypothetical protein